MEEEISLKEILISIWQGKYLIIGITIGAIIIALLASFVFITPLYETSAWVELNQAELQEWQVKEITGNNDWIEDALKDLVDDPAAVARDTAFPEVYTNWVLINVKAEDRFLAEKAVQKIGMALLVRTSELRLDQLNQEKTQVENEIRQVEQQMSVFRERIYRSYLEKLDEQKENIEFSIRTLEGYTEDYIYEQYGELDSEQKQIQLNTDQDYLALSEKKRQLLSSLIDIKLLKDQIRQGYTTAIDLSDDPFYFYLSDNKKNLLIKLYDTEYAIDNLKDNDYKEEAEEYIHSEAASDEPVNIRWKLNLVLAVVVGLMISFFVILFRAQFTK